MSPAEFVKSELGTDFRGKAVVIGGIVELSMSDIYSLMQKFKDYHLKHEQGR